MDSKTEKEWYEWLTRVSDNLTPRAGLSTREMISDVLGAMRTRTNEVGLWWIEGTAIAPMRLIIAAPSAFILAFERWLDWNKPTDEAWEVVQPPSYSAMLAKDPHAQAMIASRVGAPLHTLHCMDGGANVACDIETVEGSGCAAKDATVVVTLTGVPGAPVKLAMPVKKGEDVLRIMSNAREMAERHMLAVAQGKTTTPSPFTIRTGDANSFRFGEPTIPFSSSDAYRREYEGEFVAMGGTFRFAGRDYPYRKLTSENGTRSFVGEMASYMVDHLNDGPRTGMLVVDGREVGIAEMVHAVRDLMPQKRNVETLTITFGAPKPVEKQSGNYNVWRGNFAVPSKEAVAAAGQTFGNRYASREDVERGNGFRFGDVSEARFAEMQRVVEENLAKAMLPISPPIAFTSPPCVGSAALGPIHQAFANEIVKQLQPIYENHDRIVRDFTRSASPQKPAHDPALVAKLSAEMSAAILGPTHELDRVVERESANVPSKCDPVRWGNVVRVIAAYYSENRDRKARQPDAQWHSTVARVTADSVQHVRPVIERYEAFRREGYSRPHSYERALGSPGNETLVTTRAHAAYESAK